MPLAFLSLQSFLSFPICIKYTHQTCTFNLPEKKLNYHNVLFFIFPTLSHSLSLSFILPLYLPQADFSSRFQVVFSWTKSPLNVCAPFIKAQIVPLVGGIKGLNLHHPQWAVRVCVTCIAYEKSCG